MPILVHGEILGGLVQVYFKSFGRSPAMPLMPHVHHQMIDECSEQIADVAAQQMNAPV